ASAPPAVTWSVADPKKISVTVHGLTAEQTPELFILPPEGAAPGHPALSDLDAAGARTITFPVDPPAPAGAPWRGLLVIAKGGAREGWYIGSNPGTGATAAPASAGGQTPPAGGGSTPPAA